MDAENRNYIFGKTIIKIQKAVVENGWCRKIRCCHWPVRY